MDLLTQIKNEKLRKYDLIDNGCTLIYKYTDKIMPCVIIFL